MNELQMCFVVILFKGKTVLMFDFVFIFEALDNCSRNKTKLDKMQNVEI